MEAAIRQAKRYGKMIALLEHNELEEDENRVREAWKLFSNQFTDERSRARVVDAFYDADYETACRLKW